MTLATRACAAGLIIATATIFSPAAWTAGVVEPLGPGAQSGAASPGVTAPGHGVSQSSQVPEIAAPQTGGTPSSSSSGTAAPLRADANNDGISDSLEALLDETAPGEKIDVIVVFKGPSAPGRSRASVAKSKDAVGEFSVTREFSIINGFQASMTAAQIRALSSTPGLLRIEENAQVTAFDIFSNDDTGVTDARPAYGVDGSGVTICVLDTGINPDHEQFTDKGLTAADFKDFTPAGGTQPYGDHWHGTHVAGIAAGDGVGSSLADDAIGVAPAASLKIGKVLDAQGQGSNAQVISGIEWCAGMPEVDIISMSLGGPTTDGSDATSFAVNCAADPGYDPTCDQTIEPKVVVVSAGNSGADSGTIGAPGVAINAITVGSFAEWSGDPAVIWQDDGVYLNPFSSRGPVFDGSGNPLWIKPDIAAVGSRVLSAYIDDQANPSPSVYASASGTSMSAPFVSGVVALMLDANPDLGLWDSDGLPHVKVRQILANTAIDRGVPGKDNEYGWGLIDAFAAVAEAAASVSGTSSVLSYMPTDYPGYTRLTASVTNSGNWTHEFEVTADDVGLPIAAAMTIDGEVGCAFFFFGSCLAYYYDPDLELVVEQLSGGSWSQVPATTTGSPEVTLSECTETGECGGVGRSELVHFIPDAEGQYRFRVYPFAGDPNFGKGGTFDFEISMGAPISGPPSNSAPMVSVTSPTSGSSFVQNTSITFTGTADDAEDGNLTDALAWASDLDGPISGTGGSVSTAALSLGRHVISASVTDTGGKTGTDSITVDVTLPDGNLPPTAGFSFSTSDLTANFTDTSGDIDGTVTGWAWDFDGDGTSDSSAQNPSHVFAGSGTYTVSLTVTDNDGASDTIDKSVTVTANQSPVASFTVDRNPCGTDIYKNRCQFFDTSLDPDGTIVSLEWDFGSGTQTPSLDSTPIVQFPSDGPDPVTVTLSVTDNDGAIDSASMQVALSHPTNSPPVVSVTGPPSGSSFDEGTSITFTGTADDARDGDLTASLSWSSDLDGAITGTGGSVSTSALSVGTHVITASATDGGGLSGSDSVSVTVTATPLPNDPPTADFNFTTTDLTADFTDASGDTDGTVVGWSWNFGDGGTSTAQNPSHSYATGGTYSVSLTVTDDDGDASAPLSKDVTVTVPLHIGGLADLSVSTGGRWTATVDVLVVDDTGAPVQGAGVSGSWSSGANGGGNCTTEADGHCTISKNNLKNNVSSVTFTVDVVTAPTGFRYEGSANTATTIILAPGGGSTTNDPPTADFTVSCTDLVCDFDASGSSDPNGTISSYAWDFGDDTTGSGVAPRHTYAAGGSYTVSLIVTDDSNADSAPASQTVTVSAGGGSSITLSANGYKVKGVNTVDLNWSGFTSGSVEVLRDNATVANNLPYDNNATGTPGSYTDSTGQKGGATFTYQVCQSGTCSNTFTVTF